MNGKDLWSGNDYAHTSSISRGVNYYEGASRVKVMRVWQDQRFGAQRATTMVDVMLLADNGTPKERDGQPITTTYRARDIFMRWDEYERERTDRRERREERAAEEQRARLREEQRKERLIEGLAAKGIDKLWIGSVNDYSVSLTRRYLEQWVGISDD